MNTEGHNNQTFVGRVGRAVGNVIGGANVPKIDRNKKNKELAMWLLGGGLGLGLLGGTGVAASKYIKDMKREDDAADPDRLDDDTIYIQPTQKSASSGWALPAMGLTGGVVGSVGAYALVQKVVNDIRKKQLQGDLDEEQEKLYKAMEQERDLYKDASEGQGNSGAGAGQILLDLGLGIPLLTMIASGALTKRTLDKAYPGIARTPGKLKRIEFADEPQNNKELEEQAAAEEEGVVKEAAYQEFDDAGHEFLASIVAHMGGRHNSTNDLINAAGQGLLPDMEQTIKSAGAEKLLRDIERTPQASEQNRALGVMGLMKSASLAPTVKLMAAAEFTEKAQTLYRTINFEDTEQMVKASHFASLMGVEARRTAFPDVDTSEFDKDEDYLEKQASILSLRDLIQRSIEGNLQPEPGLSEEVAEDMDSNLNSDVNGKSMGTDQEMAQGTIDDESDKSQDDPIDQMLSGAHNDSKLNASDMATEA